MRFTSFLALVAASASVLLTRGDVDRSKGFSLPKANRPATTSKSDLLLPMNAWQARLEAEYAAIEQQEAVAILADQAGVDDETEARVPQADAEEYAETHIPASAASDEIDTALTKLSLIDLRSAAQRELARLGCYSAKIDGIWGPKSRAALQAFDTYTESESGEEPTPKLIQTLRAAPDRLCETCQPNAADESCVATAAEDSPAEATEGLSYLPPWMRGKEVASANPQDFEAAPERSAVRPAERVHRRTVARTKSRTVRRYYKRRRARRAWLPESWPGR